MLPAELIIVHTELFLIMGEILEID